MKALAVAAFGMFALAFPHAGQAEPLRVVTESGQARDFQVAIANTDDDRARGLMGVTALPENQGMLFEFNAPEVVGFWMKDTLIPLDMVFIRPDGVISGVHSRARPGDLTPIYSPGPVAGVLELAGGVAEKLGISAGQSVFHPFFRKGLAKD